MSKNFSIDATFRAIDRMTKPVQKMTRNVTKQSRIMASGFGASVQKMGIKTKAFFRSQKALTRSWRNSVSRMENKIRGLGGTLSNLAKIGFAAGIAGTIALLKKSSDLWDKQAQAIANVEATIKSTGGSAGRTLEQLEQQAINLQQNTFFGDEAILRGVTAQMLTFTNITGKSFDRAQQVALDVTAKLRGLEASETDLQSTTIMLSKALNDPVANLGALGRAGIQFSETQKNMIKSMARSGNMMGAQNIILQELETQYGGTASALTKTGKGMELQVKNLTGDVMELIGKGILPLRLEFLQFVKAILPTIKSHLPAFIGAVKKVAKILVVVGGAVFGVIKFLSPLIPFIIGAVVAFKALSAIMAIVNIVMTANPIGLIIVGIGLLIAIIILLIDNWDTVKEVMIGFWNKLVEWFMIGINWVMQFKDVLMLILGPFGMIINVIIALVSQWDRVKAAFQSGGILGAIMAIGSIIKSALISPIQKVLSLISKIPGMGGIANGISDALGISAGVTTQGESVSNSIQTNNNNQNVTIQNESRSPVRSGGKTYKTGSSFNIAPSGA